MNDDELIDFLLARYNDDTTAARRDLDSRWAARIAADANMHRCIVTLCSRWLDVAANDWEDAAGREVEAGLQRDTAQQLLRILAAPYSHHAAWRGEWAPGQGRTRP